jgi:hypothetical protein
MSIPFFPLPDPASDTVRQAPPVSQKIRECGFFHTPLF